MDRMRLLDCHNATVPREKVRDYLLSFRHPVGRHKAVFFGQFGFTREEAVLLIDALKEHAVTCEVMTTEETAFGMRYTIEGRLRCPDGRTPRIRAVWFIGLDDPLPRLVTAYPAPRDKE